MRDARRPWGSQAEVTECAEAEISCLGSVLLDNRAFDALSGLLRPEAFADARHGVIWRAMDRLVSSRTTVDPQTLSLALEESGDLAAVGGVAYLLALGEAVATWVNVEHHGRIIRDFAAKRTLIRQLEDGAAAARATPIGEVPALRDGLVTRLIGDESDVATTAVDVADAAAEVVTDLRARYGRPEPVPGIPSGLVDIDAITCGWADGALYTIGACSGHGKTLLGVHLSAEAARLSRRHSLYLSVEVKPPHLARRLLANYGQVDATALRTAALDDEALVRLQVGASRLKALRGLMSIVYAPRGTVSTIHREVRRYLLRKSEHPLGLVVVDYVQRLHADERRRSREEEVADIARSLKDLANMYDVPVIALAQLNREVFKRASKRPVASDLRESAALEHESDGVLFLHRPELWGEEGRTNEAEIIVAKARDGETGLATVGLDASRQRIFNLERRRDAYPRT